MKDAGDNSLTERSCDFVQVTWENHAKEEKTYHNNNRKRMRNLEKKSDKAHWKM
jgi:hypothetical protein